MNHHLRFVGPATIAAGVILGLSSCSSKKVDTLTAAPEHEITYEIMIYDGGLDAIKGEGPAILDPEAVAILTKNLDKAPSFKATTGGPFDKTITLSNKKDFIYPSAYDPPKFANPGQNKIFPVTPAEPKDLVTTKVGTTISVTGSKGDNDILSLTVKLDRKVLLGFVNHGKPITTKASDCWVGTLMSSSLKTDR